MKKVSLADIANELGVSKTLVSMVLNKRGDENGISPVTQERVWEKARELNYKPNKFARGLRMGRSNTIGLLVADISNVFYATICRAVERVAAERGYQLIICSSDEKADRESELIHTLRDWQVDGIIVSTTLESSIDLQEQKKEGFPFVLIDRKLTRLETDYIGVENFEGARIATEHLLELGHRKIGMLSISPGYISSVSDRVKGYKQAIKDAGLRVNHSLIREIPFDDVKKGVGRELADLMQQPNAISAVFMANNNLTAAMLEWAQEKNINIPRDLAVVSFDDIDMFKFCYPPITAVSQPVERIGAEAARVLIDRIEEKQTLAPVEQITLPTELVVRRSCGKYLAVNQL